MTKVIKLNETQTLTREYEVEEIRELENKLNINAVIKENNKNKIIDYYYREILLGNMISDNAKTFLMKFVFWLLFNSLKQFSIFNFIVLLIATK